MVKSCGWVVGGPCDYCVSPNPKYWVFGFFRPSQDFEVSTWDLLGWGMGTWTRDLLVKLELMQAVLSTLSSGLNWKRQERG